MRFRIWTALGLALALAACSSDNNGGNEPIDSGSSGKDAGRDSATPSEDAATSEQDAATSEQDAAVPSRLSRPALERPPTRGLPDSLRPPR